MRPKRKIPLAIILAALGCLIFPLVLTRVLERRRATAHRDEYRFPSAELASLDRMVQARFAVVPTNDFGMGRIGPRHELFRPVTPAERAAIDDLRRARQDVVFFVAGRNYLQNWDTAGAYKAFLQGPVYMTQQLPLMVVPVQSPTHWKYGAQLNQPVFRTASNPQDLPSEAQLKEPVEAMLVSSSRWDHSATPSGKTFKAGRWDVAAVPVRATDQACVACHNHLSRRDPPRLGDPLGIALYVYRRAKTQSTQVKL